MHFKVYQIANTRRIKYYEDVGPMYTLVTCRIETASVDRKCKLGVVAICLDVGYYD